jgi:hypothetical protein
MPLRKPLSTRTNTPPRPTTDKAARQVPAAFAETLRRLHTPHHYFGVSCNIHSPPTPNVATESVCRVLPCSGTVTHPMLAPDLSGVAWPRSRRAPPTRRTSAARTRNAPPARQTRTRSSPQRRHTPARSRRRRRAAPSTPSSRRAGPRTRTPAGTPTTSTRCPGHVLCPDRHALTTEIGVGGCGELRGAPPRCLLLASGAAPHLPRREPV